MDATNKRISPNDDRSNSIHSLYSLSSLPFRCVELCEGVYSSGKKKGKSCENTAAFFEEYSNKKCKIKCGMHSKDGYREELKRGAKPESVKVSHDDIDAMRLVNEKTSSPGDVIVSKMGMFKRINIEKGYQPIYPNFRHGGKDLGMPTLSPMNLGPVEHFNRAISPSLNLENFYQASKVYSTEIDEDDEPTPEFYSMRKKMFADSTGHRHKYKRGMRPLYSIHYNEEGKELRLTYVQSRYFYCFFYQKLARQTKEFRKLKKMRKDGYNLQIIGYDGYPVELKEDQTLKDAMYAYYKDESRPFGHEVVLFCMLVLKKSDYPWLRYRRRHKSVYR